jgi:hypothetical protein
MSKVEQNFRTFINERGKEKEFTVYIIHGQSDHWQKVDAFIREELMFNTEISVKKFTGGIVLQKIKNAVWNKCDCAVAILSPDDILADGQKNPRLNAIFEMGYCMGYWDRAYQEIQDLDPVIIIKEQSIEPNSDLNGIEFAEYHDNDIKGCYRKLQQGLELIFTILSSRYSHISKDPTSGQLKQDMAVLQTYMQDRDIKFISFEKLERIFDKRFRTDYIMKMVHKFPDQMRIATLKGERPGIKML